MTQQLQDRMHRMKPHKSQMALQDYLDGLLQEAEVEPQLPLQERPVPVAEPPRILSTLTTAVLTTATPETTRELTADRKNDTPLAAVTDSPGWAGQPFECLLFDVAGLKLAVPLVCLGSIYPLEGDEITPIFAQPDWFIGVMPTPAGNLRVLDTARWVMPERYSHKLRDSFRFVISIDGHSWGLAVNAVHQSIRLQPEAVKWRTRRAERQWLAGTVIEHMCALLDVQALAQLVNERERVRQIP